MTGMTEVATTMIRGVFAVDGRGQRSWRVYVGARALDPYPSQRLWYHSEGIAWGYCGSGPCQLALALLLAQRAADVGEHEQLVRDAALPEAALAHLPPPGASREAGVQDLRRRRLEKRRETELLRAAPEEPRLRRGEHPALGEYIARCPDREADIRELFPALAMMEGVKPSVVSPAPLPAAVVEPCAGQKS